MLNLKIGIVLLNFNNVFDTENAVKSIIESKNSENFSLIVVDNASTDDSWNTLTSTNYFDTSILSVNNRSEFSLNTLPKVHLLQTQENKGYAFGNNCGIKQCLLDPSINFIWILNNDIEVDANCLYEIVLALQNSYDSIDIWGTLLAKFYDKSTLQAVGGKYFPILAKTKLLLPNLSFQKLDMAKIEAATLECNYFIGASIIFSKSLFKKIGLFNEEFFLYGEEIDIFLRAKKSGFKKALIEKAIVFHKEGGTTNSLNQEKTIPSTFIQFHNCRSKLIFTRIHYLYFYPIVYLFIVANLLWVYRHHISKALKIIKSLHSDTYLA